MPFRNKSTATKPNTVLTAAESPGLLLVVGDWIVDEYWFLVRHQSRISSHTGFVHYRLGTLPEAEILDLCGAGHVARVLFSLQQRHHLYEIVGLGNWNERDTDLIRHLIHARKNPDCEANVPGFRLFRTHCDLPAQIGLYTLSPEGPTTRVIRQYHREPTGVQQINRIDWETEEPSHPLLSLRSLPIPNPPKKTRISIIINDLRKGVVTDDLIRQLRGRFPKAGWFVRSKLGNAPWLADLKDQLELLVIGPEVAAKYSPWDSWLSSGSITLQALETINSLPGKAVILISDRREVIAHLRSSDECVTVRSQSNISPITQLGWPTAVLAILVDRAFQLGGAPFFREHVENAASVADSLAEITIAASLVRPEVEQPIARVTSWTAEKDTWKAARQKLGLIARPEGQEFDVWRGSTSLPGYIACIRQKEEIVTRIGQSLRGFKRDTSRHSPLSILLLADPGAGKTYLAKTLAAKFNFAFLRFDITQMIHRDDLLELFDLVATRQANEKVDLLVFVDEINATLDRGQVYGAFLSPLEEGYYVRRGSSFALRPCVWLFAGTGGDDERAPKTEKFSDFESRMTLVEKIDFKSLQAHYTNETDRLQEEARLEQVYLGAAMIHRYHPDVTAVSEAVLKQFHKLDPASSPARRIRKMCASLNDVQYGRISRRNCDAWQLASWDEGAVKKFVKINF